MAACMPPRPEGVGDRSRGATATTSLRCSVTPSSSAHEEGDCPQSGRSADEIWERAYGPTKALANSLDGERRAALPRDWVACIARFRNGAGISQPRHPPTRPRDPRGVVTEVHRIAALAVSWMRGVQAPAESDGS